VKYKTSKIKDLLDKISGQNKVPKGDYLLSGKYEVVDQGNRDASGFCDDESMTYKGPMPAIIFGDHTCRLKYQKEPFCLGADGTQIMFTKKINQDYFYYAIRGLLFKQSGYQRHYKLLKEKNIKYPEGRDDQSQITSVLSAYDVLIENNEKRIKILEETAQLLYTEWFVKFRFPGYKKVKMMDSGIEFGVIPEGWEIQPINYLLENNHVSAKSGEHLSSRSYVPIECISRKSFVLRTSISSNKAQSSLILFEKNDILFGAMRPYFHKVAISPFAGVTRTTCLTLRPKNSIYRVFALLTIFSDSFISFASANTKGATIPYATWNDSLENYKVVFPDDKMLRIFENKLTSMIDELNSLSETNNNLIKIRDLLIPELVTGRKELK